MSRRSRKRLLVFKRRELRLTRRGFDMLPKALEMLKSIAEKARRAYEELRRSHEEPVVQAGQSAVLTPVDALLMEELMILPALVVLGLLPAAMLTDMTLVTHGHR